MVKKNNDQTLKSEDKKHQFAENAAETGEESLIGDMADLESDDDTLENAHEMGLYTKDDGEHPQELGIADQLINAEKNRRGLD